MESKLFHLTSSNNKENRIQNFISLTPKAAKEKNIIFKIKTDNNPFLKAFFSTTKIFFNNNQNILKNNFSNSNKKNPSSNLKFNNNNSYSFQSQTQKKESPSSSLKFFTEIKNIFDNQNLSIKTSKIKFNKNSFLNKKRNLMTSEELEIEQIKKEKAASKKLLEKNKKFYHKSLSYTPIHITPTPLTTFKPFNLSCNKNTKYIKEGKCCTLYETSKLNQKIRKKMQEKIEALNDTKIKNQIFLNNAEYLRKQNILYNDLFIAPKSIVKDEEIKDNKNISFENNWLTPHKKENFNSNLNTKNNQFNQNNFMSKSKIINYYLSNIKKSNKK